MLDTQKRHRNKVLICILIDCSIFFDAKLFVRKASFSVIPLRNGTKSTSLLFIILNVLYFPMNMLDTQKRCRNKVCICILIDSNIAFEAQMSIRKVDF